MDIEKTFRNGEILQAEELNDIVDIVNTKADKTAIQTVSNSLNDKVDATAYNNKIQEINNSLESKLPKSFGTSQAKKSLIVGVDGNVTTGEIIQIKALDDALTTGPVASLSSVRSALDSKANNADIGSLASLSTAEKSSIVNALNEVFDKTKINISEASGQPGHVVISIG